MMWAYVATVYISLYILLLLLQEFTQLNVTWKQSKGKDWIGLLYAARDDMYYAVVTSMS